jgi:hypothetical protein
MIGADIRSGRDGEKTLVRTVEDEDDDEYNYERALAHTH